MLAVSFSSVRSVMVLLLMLFAITSSSNVMAECNTTITYLKGQLNNLTTTFGGRLRTYRVWVPEDHSDESPLVFVFHGGGGGGLQIRRQAQFELVARDALVVYADGTGAIQTWNSGNCCGFALTNSVDDIGFVDRMITLIKANACVDESRIYATGMSNGAMLSHRIACELSDKFAAVAGVAAQLQFASCNPTTKIGVLMIHGFSDSNVPMVGGVGCGISSTDYFNISYGINKWVDHNQCACRSSECTQRLATSTPSANCSEYCTGDSSAVRVQTCFGNWTHTWPRPNYDDQEPVGGCPSAFGPLDFNASTTVWDFFQQHQLVTTQSPTLSPTVGSGDSIQQFTISIWIVLAGMTVQLLVA